MPCSSMSHLQGTCRCGVLRRSNHHVSPCGIKPFLAVGKLIATVTSGREHLHCCNSVATDLLAEHLPDMILPLLCALVEVKGWVVVWISPSRLRNRYSVCERKGKHCLAPVDPQPVVLPEGMDEACTHPCLGERHTEDNHVLVVFANLVPGCTCCFQSIGIIHSDRVTLNLSFGDREGIRA